jgi:glutamyl-tRNA synthetase
MSFNQIKKLVNENFSEEFWEAIKLNIESLEDISFWLDIVYKKKTAVNINEKYRDVIKIARLNLPKEINSNTWSIWTKMISKLSGKKGKEIFLPLRFLLTGLNSGPEMNLIIPLFDREEILRRLNV